jgi:ABC-type glycerol-3-phosphate transport system substrate-binding protein
MKTKIGVVNLLMASVLAFTAILGGIVPQQTVQAYSVDYLHFTKDLQSDIINVVVDEPKINEFSASTTGTDVEYVEIYGDAETDYSTYTILEIEGDFSDTATGTIDEVISVGTTDANGLYLASLPANALENGTITLLLV